MYISYFKRKKTGGVSVPPTVVLFLVALLLMLGAIIYAFNDEEARTSIFKWRLGSFANADYSSLVSMLVQDERYDEASRIADFALAHPEMPGQDEISQLKSTITSRTRGERSVLERGRDLLGGFMSGGGDSTEEKIGGLISNLLISAGIPEESIPGRTSRESDDLVRSLSKAGLGIDSAWFPAVMGTLRLSGVMTVEFEAFLSSNAERSESEGKPTEALASVVRDTRRLVTSMGPNSTAGLFKGVHDERDVALLADWGGRCPDETYILASLGGMEVFSKLPEPPTGETMLRDIARKGIPAIESAKFWLK